MAAAGLLGPDLVGLHVTRVKNGTKPSRRPVSGLKGLRKAACACQFVYSAGLSKTMNGFIFAGSCKKEAILTIMENRLIYHE